MERKAVRLGSWAPITNGKGPGGSSARTVGARRFLALLLAAAGTFMFLPARAGNPAVEASCEGQCLKDYEEDGTKCGKIKDEEAFKTCHNEAYGRYKGCRESCTKKQGDCLEHCKELCYQIMDKCKEDCKNDPNPRECRSRCTNAYGECLKECDNKCKGK